MKRLAATVGLAAMPLMGTGAAIAATPTAPAVVHMVADHGMHYHGTPLADGSSTPGTNMYHHG